MRRLIQTLALMLVALHAQAFDLHELSTQMAKPAVVRGPFVQEKHLRALPMPLTSQGNFVLARDFGLLWLLKTPLQQDYRISPKGIARRDALGWQMLPERNAGSEQNRLFFAVLQGDTSALERDFELQLSGDSQHWQLALTPRSLLLKQIFTQIRISGGPYVERIELSETQGDSTVLRMPQSTSAMTLTDAERKDFVQ
ncbi:outer membrane lipoprotein carrier protein LolA [Pseudomonas silvicola]|uniref:outer membrane lipoprotein carrier protein LolA n=1 Tax=Pseudomonas sp. RIT-To-2 TaxID=3462541 RepID=UPI00227B2A5C|nr:outer membrane lipoprotein carrier protein LolA [Pseudomonas silvicola]